VITHGMCFSVVVRHVGAKCYTLLSLLYLKAQIGTSHVLSNPGISSDLCSSTTNLDIKVDYIMCDVA